MASEWLAQVALPWVLAGVMMAIGLSLTVEHFIQVLRHPRRVFLGLGLQMLALPILAWMLVLVLPLPPMAAAGLLLVALVPSGATSNMFSYLVQGNVALSVSLTALAGLLTPFTLPLIMGWNLQVLGLGDQNIVLPYWATVSQLLLVTLLPALVGMILRHWLSDRLLGALVPAVKIASAAAMLGMVILLFLLYQHRLPALWSIETFAVVSMCSLAMLMGYQIARRFRLPQDSVRTVTVEVGVQNAGVAMVVAFAILQIPALGLVPLLYGILMNVPVFLWVILCLWQDRQLAEAATDRA